ncbi:MAG: signal peptidase I [Holophagaceae bacterium]|nr:signal peptidase I [Holophagaceae bacterium]
MKLWIPIAALAVALSPLAVIHPVQVSGRSMEPGLHDGELVWALWAWCAGKPERGELWLVKVPEGVSVKRAIGLPGEQVEARDGEIFINGSRLDESYVRWSDHLSGAWTCGDGYLVLGDNRTQSHDGRAWGPLPKTVLRSRVVVFTR